MRKLIQLIIFAVLAYASYKAITIEGDKTTYLHMLYASAVAFVLFPLIFPSRKKKLRPLRKKYKI